MERGETVESTVKVQNQYITSIEDQQSQQVSKIVYTMDCTFKVQI